MRSTRVLSAGSYDAKRVIDTVGLEFDDRRRRRMAMTGHNGTQFLLDLAEAPTLQDGDGLELESGEVIVVAALPERLVEFRSSDPHVITRVAWHLGNRHTPTQLLENALRVRDDYVLVEMVKKLGAEVAFVTATFQPEGGAYGLGTVSGHDHDHGHDHGHKHDHGHDGHDHAGHRHDHDHDHHDHDHAHHGHGHAAEAVAAEEARLMAETIARREARRAARAEKEHVHGPNCGHDHHGHDHHDHAGHSHDDHAHDHAHSHDHHDHDHKPKAHDHH